MVSVVDGCYCYRYESRVGDIKQIRLALREETAQHVCPSDRKLLFCRNVDAVQVDGKGWRAIGSASGTRIVVPDFCRGRGRYDAEHDIVRYRLLWGYSCGEVEVEFRPVDVALVNENIPL